MAMCADACNSKSSVDPVEIVLAKKSSALQGAPIGTNSVDMSLQMDHLRTTLNLALRRIAALEGSLLQTPTTGSIDAETFTQSIVASNPSVADQASKITDAEISAKWNKVEAFMESQITALEKDHTAIFEAAAHDLSLLAQVVQVDHEDLKMMHLREDFKTVAKVHTFRDALETMLQKSMENACSYSLQETVWDASLLIGMPLGLGKMDTVMLALALSVQAVIQGMFCVIVMKLAKDNQDTLYRYRTGCKESQSDFDLQEFELFLGSHLGPVLSCMTILIWSLCVLKDLTHIGDFALAMYHLPRGTCSSYRVHGSTRRIIVDTISFGRLATMTCSFVAQATIATCLLVVGAMWLASTVTIMDLLLNGVALNFVLEIDELVYHVFCSAKVKTVTKHLQPLSLPKSLVQPFRVPSRAISAFAIWVGLFLLMFVVFLRPNLREIADVKAICS